MYTDQPFIDARTVRPIRRRRAMPISTSMLYAAIFACGLVLGAYIVFWRQTWLDAFGASSAAAMLLVPVFVRREFVYVADMEFEFETDLRAQMVAGNERIRLAIEDNSRRLSEMRALDAEKNRLLFEEKNRLEAEIEVLRAKSRRERDEFGRFVSSKPRLLTDGRTEQTTTTTTIEGTALP